MSRTSDVWLELLFNDWMLTCGVRTGHRLWNSWSTLIPELDILDRTIAVSDQANLKLPVDVQQQSTNTFFGGDIRVDIDSGVVRN